jgi:hypothetical protein
MKDDTGFAPNPYWGVHASDVQTSDPAGQEKRRLDCGVYVAADSHRLLLAGLPAHKLLILCEKLLRRCGKYYT